MELKGKLYARPNLPEYPNLQLTFVENKIFPKELTKKILEYFNSYVCYRCKKNRYSYYVIQTISSDEPTTTFITCLNCENKWTICDWN